jgi:hypothetical protein
MNEKLKMPPHAARGSDSSSIPASGQPVSRVSSSASGREDSVREFFERRAKTDAVVRAMPGLHNFGKR